MPLPPLSLVFTYNRTAVAVPAFTPALAESDDPLYSSTAAAAKAVDDCAAGGGGAGLAPGLSLGFVNADDDVIGVSFTAADTPGICSEPYYG